MVSTYYPFGPIIHSIKNRFLQKVQDQSQLYTQPKQIFQSRHTTQRI